MKKKSKVLVAAVLGLALLVSGLGSVDAAEKGKGAVVSVPDSGIIKKGGILIVKPIKTPIKKPVKKPIKKPISKLPVIPVPIVVPPTFE